MAFSRFTERKRETLDRSLFKNYELYVRGNFTQDKLLSPTAKQTRKNLKQNRMFGNATIIIKCWAF